MSLFGRDVRRIADGTFGWLESPIPLDSDAAILVSGWAFSRGSRIVSVHAHIGSASFPLEYGRHRDDVRQVYPDDAGAAVSGFLGFVRRALSSADKLEVRATQEDGRIVTLFVRRLTRHPLSRSAETATRWLRKSTRRTTVHIQPGQLGAREMMARSARRDLDAFLQGGATLDCPEHDSPRLSIVLVLWNQAALTFCCLRSILVEQQVSYEVVIVDNQSNDDTGALLRRVRNATIISRRENAGFTVAANVGARASRGECLLFLNNDTQLIPGALRRLVATLDRDDRIGAVGGKLIYPDGRLQEAGSVIWRDGGCDAYGRGADPLASAFNFQRDVDFCSGALLMTPAKVFEEIGGFDEAYKPAYYEDADYCVKIWRSARRVTYQPAAIAIHIEFGSSPTRDTAIRLQQERRARFIERHGPWLEKQPQREDGFEQARSHESHRESVLVIDDVWPDAKLGSGYPRAASVLRALVELGYRTALYPMSGARRDRVPDDCLAEVEVIEPSGLINLPSLLAKTTSFSLILVSRPHNMAYVRAALSTIPALKCPPLVYDAEAIFSLRDIARDALRGVTPADSNQARVDRELSLASGSAAVLAVNRAEQRYFADAGCASVVVGHAITPSPADTSFDDRHGVLFVGSLAENSPNEDAAVCLVNEIGPLLQQRPGQLAITIAGARPSQRVLDLAAEDVTIAGDVEDLTLLYAAARVFVAPTRFSAGIPLKLIEAAAYGLPIVCTPALAEQLGWQPNRDVLIGSTPAELADQIVRLHSDEALWGKLRAAGIVRVTEDCGPEAFKRRLGDVLSSVLLPDANRGGDSPEQRRPAPRS